MKYGLKCPDVYTIISRFLIHSLEDLGSTESPLCTGQVTIYSRLVLPSSHSIYISEARMGVLFKKKRLTQNKSQTHPPTPTYKAACSVICSYFMLISKTVLHPLYGELEIYDEFQDCCYGFPACRIYYDYCVGQRFLTSALLPF